MRQLHAAVQMHLADVDLRMNHQHVIWCHVTSTSGGEYQVHFLKRQTRQQCSTLQLLHLGACGQCCLHSVTLAKTDMGNMNKYAI